MGCCLDAGTLEEKQDCEDSPQVEEKKECKEIKYVRDIWRIFDFKKKLGQGATADVVLVSQKDKNVLYALKMVNKLKSNHFDREYKILGRLECPNIIRLEAAYEDSDMYYFSMEYLAGDSLIFRTAKRKKYSERVASETIKMILNAVKYIHDMDIVHRDIKPENFVYLSEKDAALKMLDFGLAIEVPRNEKFSYRSGTPYFMAPEVILNTQDRSSTVCKKSDVWSIGIVLYILLNGTAPFKGYNRDELFKTVLHNPLKFENMGLSSNAKDLVKALMEKDPDKRIDVSEALEHPWIMKRGQEEDDIMESTVKALSYLHAKLCVHRALEDVAIASMDEFDDKAIKMLFDRYDKNGDGNITKEEFASALEDRHMYKQKADEIANNMLTRSDTNNDSLIDFEEFKRAMVLHQLTQDEYRMHVIFSSLDTNKNGYISIDELVHCLPDSCDELVQNITRRFKEADQDNDGELSFNEFTELLKQNEELRESTISVLVLEEKLYGVVNDNEQYSGDHTEP